MDEMESQKEHLYLSGCPPGQEFIPECEVILEGSKDSLDSLYNNCTKNPGHKNFFPVNEFNAENLPEELQTPKMVKDIFNSSVLTVRVKIAFTSLARPNSFSDNDAPYPYNDQRGNEQAVRFGTGSIVEILYEYPVTDKPCPCPKCRKSGNPKFGFWWVRARTATHVIFDKSEAEVAEFECFYNSDDRNIKKGIRRIYGIDIFNMLTRSHKKYPNDVCDVLCVTHDHDTAAIFNNAIRSDYFLTPPEELSKPYAPSSSKVVISHPHGCSKRITIGKIFNLTVPIGPDYPTEKPIPFKNGTFYRQIEMSKPVEVEASKNSSDPIDLSTKGDVTGNPSGSGNGELIGKTIESSLNSQLIEMREKFNALRSSLQDKLLSIQNPASSTRFVSTDEMSSNGEYVIDFYYMYTRVQILKILVTAAVLDQRTRCWTSDFDQLVQKAYEEVCQVFLDKEYHSTPDLTNDMPSPRLKHWIHLSAESEKDFEKFKSDRKVKLFETSAICNPSIVVLWFHELENIVENLRMKMKQDNTSVETILPLLTEKTIMKGYELLTEFENKILKDARGTGVEGSNTKNKDEGKEETRNASNEEKCEGDDGKEKTEKVETTEATKGCSDEGHNGNDDQDKNKSTEEKEAVPEGATFTLPSDSEYAFRVYSRSPGWINFPHGTVMTMPNGTTKDIGEPVFEFWNTAIQPEGSFVSYNINTCKGSSGANVYCDILGPYLGTYFPHSGYLVGGHNKSGLRDNFITLSSKLFLFSERKGPKRELGEAEKVMSVIKSTKAFLERLGGVLKKV